MIKSPKHTSVFLYLLGIVLFIIGLISSLVNPILIGPVFLMIIGLLITGFGCNLWPKDDN